MTTLTHSRLEGLDLARCLALIGMVMVNFRLAMGVEHDSNVWLLQIYTALQGRCAAAFVVLAGIGLALGLRKLERNQAVRQTLRRAAVLLVIGLLNLLVFPADIIHYYAAYFALGVMVLPMSTRAITALMVGMVLLFPGLAVVLDYNAGWDWATLTYPPFWAANGFIRNLFFNGWHPVVPWVAFLFWGVILSRLALQTRRVQAWMIFGGAIVGLLAHALSAMGQSMWPKSASWLSVVPLPPMPLYVLAGGGVATAAIGLAIVLAQRWGHHLWLRALLPAGRMTLTLYIGHILVGMGTLEAIGWLQGQGLVQVSLGVAVYCSLGILGAWLWSTRFALGPLEWLLRRVSH